MKINKLDAHDRYKHFSGQTFFIEECCQDMLKQKPFGDHSFYIFAHARTDDDGANKRLIWQPRLTKPKAQTNSMLLKVSPLTDVVLWIWNIPARELWQEFKKDNMLENQFIWESIEKFKTNREKLEEPEKDDPSPSEVQRILFEFQPQLFKRETLPKELQVIWDVKMKLKRNKL